MSEIKNLYFISAKSCFCVTVASLGDALLLMKAKFCPG